MVVFFKCGKLKLDGAEMTAFCLTVLHGEKITEAQASLGNKECFQGNQSFHLAEEAFTRSWQHSYYISLLSFSIQSVNPLLVVIVTVSPWFEKQWWAILC